MNLISDAVRVIMGNVSVHLVHDPDHGATYICLHCATRVLFTSGEAFVHAPECPTHSMPKIVAALQAADLVTIAADEERVLFGVRAGSQLVAALDTLDEALDA